MDDLTALANAVDAVIEADGWETQTVDSLGVRWSTLRDIAAVLSVKLNDYGLAVGRLLVDEDYSRKDGYELPTGERIHHDTPSREQWDGEGVLAALSTEMVDPSTGEMMSVIPRSVLLDVVPGARKVSSKWLLSGLRNLDIDPDDYRTREWKPPVARAGVGR